MNGDKAVRRRRTAWIALVAALMLVLVEAPGRPSEAMTGSYDWLNHTTTPHPPCPQGTGICMESVEWVQYRGYVGTGSFCCVYGGPNGTCMLAQPPH